MEKCSSAAFQRIQFEQDIFFGDASCDGSATFQALEMRSPAVGKKTKGCGLPPPRCQVEGCDLDLKGAKSYYWRHKVCGMHSKSPKVIVAGLEQRFCQQCSRFHLLKEFDQGKRSCRRRLAGHNERRRKVPPGLLPSRYGCLPSLPELNNRQRAFLMDFMHPRPPDATKDIILWPAARSNDRETSDLLKFSGGDMNNMRPALFSAPELAFGECIAGALDSTCALSLLSTKPWGLSAYSAGPKNERSAILITSAEFEMAQCRASECLSSSWVPKELVGGSSSSHELLLRQIQDAGGSCQFSGGLDLPAFEIRHCLGDVGPTSQVYDQLHDLHWPL